MGQWLRQALALTRLRAALERVQANHGQAGTDGLDTNTFAARGEPALAALRAEVVAGRYQPLPLKRLWLPRPDREPRPIGVPAVRDRVLQTAVAQTLQPLLEAEFEECSYAYRQGRSVRQAVERIGTLQRQGYQWVVEADIERFFDRIPHPRLLAELQALTQDAELVALVQQWLQTPVFDPARPDEPLQPTLLGVPQGSPLSPALANLYLDHLDEALLDADHALVRYADDFIVLARSRRQAEAAVELTAEVLQDLSLRLNPLKTRVVSFEQGFRFLGWNFVRSLAVPARKAAEPAGHLPSAVAAPAATSPIELPAASRPAGPPHAAPVTSHHPLVSTGPALDDSMSSAWADALAARPDWKPAPARPALAARAEPAATTGTASDPESPPGSASAPSHPDADADNNAEPPELVMPAGLYPTDPAPPATTPSVSNTADTDAGDTTPDTPPLPSLQRTLYLLDAAACLHTENRRLVVRRDGEVVLELPAVQVDQVMLYGRSSATTAALVCCMQHGIPVVLLSRLGRFHGRMEPPGGEAVALLQAQCAAQQQPGMNLVLARRFVHGKISHAMLVLNRYARHGRRHHAVPDALLLMRSLQARLKTAPDLDSVRGLEGAAAAASFGIWRHWLEPHWRFGARQQQSGTDPVNVLLDFGYTLLHHAVAGLLQARGLNPWLGHLHAVKSGHMALASDLMEEFRPVVVDTVVLNLCLNGGLQPDDFSTRGGVWTLKAPAAREFVRAIETRLNTEFTSTGSTERQDMRRLIDTQVRTLAHTYRHADPGRYQPARLR